MPDGTPRAEPFALLLYRRFISGETAEDLANDFGIPLDHIETRLDAARNFVESHPDCNLKVEGSTP